MPVARFEMPDGRVARFEVPEGTTPEQAQAMMQDFVASQGAQQPAAEAPASQPAAESGQDGPLDIMRDVAAGVGETALAFGSGAVGEVAGGLTGLGTLALTGDSQAAEAVRAGVSDQISYAPRTESGQRLTRDIATSAPVQAVAGAAEALEEGAGEGAYSATGSPAAAAIASAAPAAAAQYLGVKIPGVKGSGVIPREAGRLMRQRAGAADARAADIQAEEDALRSQRPTEQGVQQVADEMTRRRPNLAPVAEFDPAVVKAAQELGFEEIPASVAAGNAQFRAIAQGLSSVTGSRAEAQYGEFLEALANKADDLIEEGGGSLDKPALSMRYRDESNRVIDALGAQEDALYKRIDYLVPKGERIELPGLKGFIDKQISEYGSVADMPPILKRVHNLVYGKHQGQWRERHPTSKLLPESKTYQSFSQLRKEVGQALNRKSGPFKDSETGLLKMVYGAMKPVQMDVARKFGAVDLQQGADALTIKRKAVEDTMVDALGKDLSKDLMPQVSAKITGLPKGNVTKFNQFIEGVPEKMRQEVVVSALNDLLRGTGADQKGFGAARFVGFMNDLNRSPVAKNALYKYLPPATRSSLDNLSKVAAGVYKANKDTIKTGKIAQFFPENSAWWANMLTGLTSGLRMKLGAMGGRLAEAPVAALDEAVKVLLNNKEPASRKANQFIASPEFQEVIKSAIRDGVAQGQAMSRRTQQLEKLAERSARYRRWADTLEGNAAARLASAGLVGYLLYPAEPPISREDGPQ